MAKNSVTDWDATAANNTDVGGISIAEGCSPANINNAIREVMKQVADVNAATTALAALKVDNLQLNGNTISSTDTNGNIVLDPNGTGSVTTDAPVSFDGGTFVFNESGADKDARFEGDTDTNLLFLDASTDRVGIGTNSPSSKFHVSGVITAGDAVNTAKGADIASATTTDIGAAAGNFVDVTGTTTITGLGTIAAGVWRIVRFTGALTLTHNATSLILPTGANITTAAGDTALFVSLGSGNWLCASYLRASGAALGSSGILTASYDSGDQTITAAGTLSLTHGLGAKPKLIECFLKCTDAGGENGYAQNDEFPVSYMILGVGFSNNQGFAITNVSSTSIRIRFGSQTTATFGGLHATNGTDCDFTNTKWVLIVRAYA